MALLRIVVAAIVSAAAVSGCATIDLKSGFSDVSSNVQQRLGMPLYWNNGTDLDREAQDKVKAILGQKLTAEHAIQVALLNNRELQGVYADLGVAQADLVQAGLLKNPIFDAVVTFPVSGGRPDFELTAVMSFLDIFYLPLRKRVAAGRFEEAKTRVTGAVLDLAGKVRSVFFEHVANEQLLELHQSIVQALAASRDVAQRLHQAGNISDLDFARERVLLEGAKLRLRSAEVASRQSRERLNILMGLWGSETEWQTKPRYCFNRGSRWRCARGAPRRTLGGRAGAPISHPVIRSGAGAHRTRRRGIKPRAAGILRACGARARHRSRRRGPSARRARSRVLLPRCRVAVARARPQ